MRHRFKGTELNIDTSHRKALNKFMATSFIESGHMTTTLAKARFVKPFIEKLVTKAKGDRLAAVRHLKTNLNTREAVDTLLDKVAPKFAQRAGGYTRLVKLVNRLGDNAPMARLEWVEKIEEPKKVTKENKKAKVENKKEVKPKAEKKSEKVTKKVSKEQDAK